MKDKDLYISIFLRVIKILKLIFLGKEILYISKFFRNAENFGEGGLEDTSYQSRQRA